MKTEDYEFKPTMAWRIAGGLIGSSIIISFTLDSLALLNIPKYLTAQKNPIEQHDTFTADKYDSLMISYNVLNPNVMSVHYDFNNDGIVDHTAGYMIRGMNPITQQITINNYATAVVTDDNNDGVVDRTLVDNDGNGTLETLVR